MRELGPFLLEKAQGELVNVYKYLMELIHKLSPLPVWPSPDLYALVSEGWGFFWPVDSFTLFFLYI